MSCSLHITLPAKVDFLSRFVEAVGTCARDAGFGDEKVREITVAAEESFVNIAGYAYPGATGDVELFCMWGKENLVVEIIDRGVPFDSSSLPDPDIAESLEARKVGGLGIYLMKKFVDNVHYERRDNKNILRLTINKTSTRGIESGKL